MKAADSATPAQAVEQESTRLLDAIQPGDLFYVLDERGAQMTSVELSNALNKHEISGVKRAVFIVGGAYGLNQAVRSKGKLWSLSKLTLPHEMCRTLLLEQLYRARTIQRGEPYHHV